MSKTRVTCLVLAVAYILFWVISVAVRVGQPLCTTTDKVVDWGLVIAILWAFTIPFFLGLLAGEE